MRTIALLMAFGLEAGTLMPAAFEQGLVFLDMPAPDHSTVRIFSDSCGPTAFTLSAGAASRLQLQLRSTTNEALLTWLGPNVRVANASDYMRRHWGPPPPARQFVINPGAPGFQGYPAESDGTFGEKWFGRHTWTWDYPRSELILRPKDWRPQSDAHEFMVSFETDEAGRRIRNCPRMMIRVDGVEIPVLFDSGAHAVLTPTALRSLADGGPAQRSASMISHSVFERWRQLHADWRILEDAQLKTHSRMIRAANLEVAGFTVGPVWFAEREDEDFLSGQAQGAIGANALAGFTLSVDYPSSRAWLQTKDSRH